VWEFRPDGDGGTLTLIYESPSAAVLNFPDNLAVSPQGALLLCEDAPGFNQFLRGVTLDGKIFDFAHNLETSREWAGATFADADPSWNARRIRGGNRPLGGRWDRITDVRSHTAGGRRRGHDVRHLGPLGPGRALVYAHG
jgi:hypothetical protein